MVGEVPVPTPSQSLHGDVKRRDQPYNALTSWGETSDMSPAINLAIAAAVAVLGFLLLRSQRGLLWKWSRSRKLAERAQIEDALKHCHGCEYEQRTPTLASLASALAIGRDEAANLATRLESLSLLTVGEQGLRSSG